MPSLQPLQARFGQSGTSTPKYEPAQEEPAVVPEVTKPSNDPVPEQNATDGNANTAEGFIPVGRGDRARGNFRGGDRERGGRGGRGMRGGKPPFNSVLVA